MIPGFKHELVIQANSRKFLIWVEPQFCLAMTFEHVSYPFLVVHSPPLYVILHFSWKGGANSSRLNGDDLKHLRNSEIIWQPGSWMFSMVESQGNWRIMWYWNVPLLLKGVLGLHGANLWNPYRIKGRPSIGSGPPSKAVPFPAIWFRGVSAILFLKTRFFGQKKQTANLVQPSDCYSFH